MTGTQTETFMREIQPDPRDKDLFQVVNIDSKGVQTVIGRGLTRDEALAWLTGKHPMPGRKVGVLPESRFDRKILDEP